MKFLLVNNLNRDEAVYVQAAHIVSVEPLALGAEITLVTGRVLQVAQDAYTIISRAQGLAA